MDRKIDYLAIANVIWNSNYKMSAVGWRDCLEEEFSDIIKLIMENANNPELLQYKLSNLYKYHPRTIYVNKYEMENNKHCYIGDKCNCYLPDVAEKEYYCNILMEEKLANGSRNYPEYLEWRSNVFARDKYICQKCGARGVEINAHHIKSFKDYPDLRTELSNGITLCKYCHTEEHKRLRTLEVS